MSLNDTVSQRDERIYFLAIAVLTIAATYLRIQRIEHPMRYDESYTFLHYVSAENSYEWLCYTAPNNHVFHTLLSRMAVAFGGIGPPVVRLPALLAGIAIVPLTAIFARALSESKCAGVVAASFACVSTLLIEYSVNARGYTIVCCCTLVLAYCGLRLLRDWNSTRYWILFTVAAALGMFTIPTMLYSIALVAIVSGIHVWLCRSMDSAQKRRLFRRAGLVTGAAGVLTILLYSPTFFITGVGTFAGKLTTHTELALVVSNLPQLGLQIAEQWTEDLSWALRIVLAAGLAFAIGVGVRMRNIFLLIPIAVVILFTTTSLVQRVLPFPRIWLFALPLLFAVAATGIVSAARAVFSSKPMYASIAAVILTLPLCCDAASRSMNRTYLISEAADTLVDARTAVSDAIDAQLCGPTTALVWDWNVPNWPPLQYYAVLLCRPEQYFPDYRADACQRVLIALTNGRSLEELMEHRSELSTQFDAPVVWRTYPGLTLYLAGKKAAR